MVKKAKKVKMFVTTRIPILIEYKDPRVTIPAKIEIKYEIKGTTPWGITIEPREG